MKILAIGDIHGLNTWKEIVEKTEYDVCVFVGDYFDSFDIDTDEQIKNFNEIMEFKRTHPDSVITLAGNHDLHYLLGDVNERYSGFQHHRHVDIREALEAHLPLLQFAYSKDGFLFTHAGVTKTWCEANGVNQEHPDMDINNLALKAFGFNHDRDKSNCGEHKSQGPMWVRPESLMGDAIEGIKQVVGHTRHEKPDFTQPGFVFIDSLWNGWFVIIDDGNITSIKVYEG